MRTLKLTLEYDGTHYQGWQLQPQAPTIQGALETCLLRILGAPHRVHGAGRTDAGVHARGQVAHIHLEHPMSPSTLWRAMNATLPRDIAVRNLEEVSRDFHARKQAHRKLYRYQLLNSPLRSVFLDGYAWHIHFALQRAPMDEVCTLLHGRHNFRAFCAADSSVKTFEREIFACGLRDGPESLLIFEIEGSGFLKQMVRTLVGTLLEVGTGRRTVDSFARLLEEGDRRKAGKTAPARGLWLERVVHGEPGAGQTEGVNEEDE